MTIAFVDDDEAILDSVRMAMEYRGWSILTNATGEAFLACDAVAARIDCYRNEAVQVARRDKTDAHGQSRLTYRPTVPAISAIHFIVLIVH